MKCLRRFVILFLIIGVFFEFSCISAMAYNTGDDYPYKDKPIGENAFGSFGDVVIYGVPGSAAEAYAGTNGLTFIPVSEK